MRKAQEYKQVDEEYRLHAAAYLMVAAQGKRKSGKNKEKPLYPTFDKFFNYKKELDKVENKGKKNPRAEAMRAAMRKRYD